MSKAKKKEYRLKRRAQKASRKALRRAQYEAWAAAGTNRKRIKRDRKHNYFGVDHPLGACGNIGCRKCNPAPYNLVTPTHLRLS